MNLGIEAIFIVVAINVIISIPLLAYAVSQSQYDEDGFTIFTGKSSDYMYGYRSGVIHADKDVQLMNDGKINGVDARQENIKCPRPDLGADCNGFRDGYSDEAMDQLE